MSSIYFKVYGQIQPKQRPRFNHITGHTYTPTKTHKYEDAVKAAYLAKYPSGMWVTNKEQPIEVSVEFHFAIPDSWSKKKKEKYVGKWCLKHIDLDNIYKALTDAINGICIPDDSQIVLMNKVSKVWDTEEYVSIRLTELEAEDG